MVCGAHLHFFASEAMRLLCIHIAEGNKCISLRKPREGRACIVRQFWTELDLQSRVHYYVIKKKGNFGALCYVINFL